jgi:hypothetical protein
MRNFFLFIIGSSALEKWLQTLESQWIAHFGLRHGAVAFCGVKFAGKFSPSRSVFNLSTQA